MTHEGPDLAGLSIVVACESAAPRTIWSALSNHVWGHDEHSLRGVPRRLLDDHVGELRPSKVESYYLSTGGIMTETNDETCRQCGAPVDAECGHHDDLAPSHLTETERAWFRRYAESSTHEPDGEQCQWAHYGVRLLDELEALIQPFGKPPPPAMQTGYEVIDLMKVVTETFAQETAVARHLVRLCQRESFPVTHDLNDAPDGAEVDGMKRVGNAWEAMEFDDLEPELRIKYLAMARDIVATIREGRDG